MGIYGIYEKTSDMIWLEFMFQLLLQQDIFDSSGATPKPTTTPDPDEDFSIEEKSED